MPRHQRTCLKARTHIRGTTKTEAPSCNAQRLGANALNNQKKIEAGESTNCMPAGPNAWRAMRGSLKSISFRQWRSPLLLIEGCYSGQASVGSEFFFMIGAPDQMCPFAHIHAGRNSPSPARVFLASARSTGSSCFRPSSRRLFAIVEDCPKSGKVIVCRWCIIMSVFFVHCTCELATSTHSGLAKTDLPKESQQGLICKHASAGLDRPSNSIMSPS